jgi:hypothetical protein
MAGGENILLRGLAALENEILMKWPYQPALAKSDETALAGAWRAHAAAWRISAALAAWRYLAK